MASEPVAKAPLEQARALDTTTRWYALDLSDQRAGHTVSTRLITPDAIVSTTEMVLSIARGQMELKFSTRSEFTETPDGEAVSVRYTQDFGLGPRETRWRFEGDRLHITEIADGRETSKMIDRPEGDWLPPAAAARFVAERLAQGETEITVTTIDPGAGTAPITSTRSNIEPVKLTINGEAISAYRCDVTTSAAPQATSVEYLDTSGEAVQSEMTLGALSIEMVETSKAVALGRVEPAEIMTSVFVKPSSPIHRPRRLTRATYFIQPTDGDPISLPTLGAQLAKPLNNGVQLEVSLLKPAETGPTTDEARAEYLASTSLCEVNDKAVQDLTARALRGAPDDRAARAEQLRRFVYRHVDAKDLSVGFATAAETARSGTGDCTEHGVLLAAMLRADGIPSRVVSGLVYADAFAGARQIFGYHMWTQALLPDADGTPRWIDIDATLPDATPFDATHIAIAVSSLADDRPTGALLDVASLMGRIDIDIDSLGYEQP